MSAGHGQPSRRKEGFGRKLLRSCAYALAGVALLGAATLGGLRMFLPEVGRYRPEIEAWLSRIADRQVEFGTIDTYWRGWTPVFRITDVRLAGKEAGADAPAEPSIRLAVLGFSVDPLELLRSGVLRPREIAAGGASLAVVRRPDGTLAVEGFGQIAPAEPREGSRLARWIPDRERISLSASRILWIDERHGSRPLPLDGVTLHLEGVGDRYRLSGSFEPPEAGRVDFAMDVAGDPLTTSWTGEAYVAARDVDVARLGLDALRPGTGEVSGVVSGQVWSTWNGGRFVEAEGTIHARSPGVVRGGGWRGFDEVGASFKVERDPEGWTLAVRDLAVTTSGGAWPPSGVAAKWTPPRDGRDGTLVVNAGFVRIQDLLALTVPHGDARADPVLHPLIEAVPRGAIEDLRVSAPVTDRVELERARAGGRFTRLHIGPEGWPVSIHAAGGRFEAGGRGMVAEVESGGLRLSAPDWLARPLEGGKLAGVFAAVSSPEGFRIRFDGASHTAEAGRIDAEGWMFEPRDGSPPELSVALSLGASRIAAARALLSDRVVPEPASRWLESAVPYGDVRGARLTFHGRLPETPSGAGTGAPGATAEQSRAENGAGPGSGTGTLDATAELVVPVLGYARDWPEVTDLSAVVGFDGRRLDVRLGSGRILGSDVREARITVEDLDAETPVAQVEARIEGASANVVRFLAESPLRARFTPAIDHFAIHGDSTIDLELAIPLDGDEQSITLDGRITLDDNRIDVPGLHRSLEAVNGTIAFGSASVESDGITATWLGEPVRAVIGASPEAPDATRLSIHGRLTPRLLAAYLHDAGFVETTRPGDSPLLARIRGEAAWNAALDVPHAGGARAAKLRVASDLAGLSLDLPPPFGKTGETARPLDVDGHVTPGVESVVEVRHGDVASAALRFVPDAAGRLRIERGAVRAGPGDAALPDTPGVTVHGALPVLDTGAWGAFLEDATAYRAPGADASWLDHVREVSIDAGSVTALGVRFPETRIRAAPGAGGDVRLELAGPHLEGVVWIPPEPGAGPVIADLERFVPEPGFTGAGNAPHRLDPRTLPALSFSARRFVFGDVDLGHVGFTTAPSEHGMQLERLDVRAGSFEGEADGSWSVAGEEHRSAFTMRIHGDDLGRMLDSLGLDGSGVTGGTTSISLRGSWPGTPADFALDRLAGVMHFLSTDGRVTRIEPGVIGRAFGLLTITSLPRRLVLDFGDLFRDGFEYDRIDGSFAIENGNAHTADLFMDSDTARFEVAGRTGLVSEDYDKRVTVLPKISSSLPLLGLPFLNPALLPVWVAQMLLDRNVFDKAFAYRYTVTGTWDEPVVELARTWKRQGDSRE